MDRVLLCRTSSQEQPTYKLIQTYPNGKLDTFEFFLDKTYEWKVIFREPTWEEFKTYRCYIVVELQGY